VSKLEGPAGVPLVDQGVYKILEGNQTKTLEKLWGDASEVDQVKDTE